MSAQDRLRLESDRRQVRVALCLMLLPLVWFVRTDFLLYEDDWPHLLLRLTARSGAVLFTTAGIWAMARPHTPERHSRIVLSMAICFAAYMVTTNVLRPQGATLSLRTPLFNLFLLYAALPNRYWRQCLPPLIMSAGLILLRLTWLTSAASNDVPGDIVIIMVANALGILMVRHRLRLEEQLTKSWEEAMVERHARQRAVDELAALRGIIPICVHCKNVRTEVGGWHRIESYVKAHIDADFSHGICPECLARHYAELV